MNGITRTKGVCHGRPVVEGTGIETSILIDRFLAGDSLDTLAIDYDLSIQQVACALRFECCKACPCKDCKRDTKIPLETP